MNHLVDSGCPHPLGATPDPDGVNFSIFSGHATAVDLLLFESHDDPEPSQIIELDPYVNKTFHFWHVYVKDLRPGVHYAYRIDGPPDPSAGHRYNRNKVLIDPYARGNTRSIWNRSDACGPHENVKTSMRSVVIDVTGYDWEGDRPLRRPMEETIIYEMHVRGFTRSESSQVQAPGTFSAIIEKIPYLKELGITAIELLPICDFDETEILRVKDGKPLRNYWGYSTLGFFAPEADYCVSAASGSQMDEFRDMVKALHQAGIEVILDMVFNHTDEGNHLGPVYSFKGIDNRVYYLLDPSDPRYYMDFTGTGNTFNCNHPIPEKLIIDCLRHWVCDNHVDGFRFDEASILSRGEDGIALIHPPVVWQIELDEDLAETKLIAEAWDAAGLYQIGRFPGDRWAEWNGRFRDDIRRFVKGDPGVVGAVASRIAGSSDLYQDDGELPINSINFVSCHDGFTVNDLVSYNDKHNEANGEDNRDGIDNNLSWNCGVEGPSNNPAIESLRERQIRNFAALLFISRGVPMILAGDEVRRTQNGNNNSYCQDNETNWFDWTLLDRNPNLFRFWKRMIDFRKRHSALRSRYFFKGEINERDLRDVSWHGCHLNNPGWDDPNGRALAMTIAGFKGEEDIHVMMNMYSDSLTFEIPVLQARRWYLTVATAAPSPNDIAEPGSEVRIDGNTFDVPAQSIVILVSK